MAGFDSPRHPHVITVSDRVVHVMGLFRSHAQDDIVVYVVATMQRKNAIPCSLNAQLGSYPATAMRTYVCPWVTAAAFTPRVSPFKPAPRTPSGRLECVVHLAPTLRAALDSRWLVTGFVGDVLNRGLGKRKVRGT